MRAAVYYNHQDIRMQEMPQPKIDRDEVLVQMKACGVCGSDLMDWYLKARAPLVLGHEPSGIVSEVGEEVKAVNIGDRVFVHHHVACFTCHYCLHGDYTLCEQFHNTNIKPGGFAEYFKVPSLNLQGDTLKLPEPVTFEEATLIEPTGCCLKAIRKTNLQVGDSVLILGAGATGIIHVALSRLFAAGKVFAADLYDFRLRIAEKSGADVIINPMKEDVAKTVKAETQQRGADVVIVTAPSVQAYKTGLAACRRGGKLCVFAPTTPGERLDVSPKELFFSEIQVIPSYSTSHVETRMALELLQSGRLRLKDLISHRFRLEETAEAFKVALESKDSLKVVVLNEESA